MLLSSAGSLWGRVEEQSLWSSRQLGEQSPAALLRSLVYLNTKYFGLRTVEQHLRLSFANVYGPDTVHPVTKETSVCIRVPSISQDHHGEACKTYILEHVMWCNSAMAYCDISHLYFEWVNCNFYPSIKPRQQYDSHYQSVSRCALKSCFNQELYYNCRGTCTKYIEDYWKWLAPRDSNARIKLWPHYVELIPSPRPNSPLSSHESHRYEPPQSTRLCLLHLDPQFSHIYTLKPERMHLSFINFCFIFNLIFE